ncbi:MAG: hypothetical protein HY016_05000 [Nitrosomonadales bacterium]|nr:hypothetical protein [Nitrosomonadales bacterium]
MRNQFLSGLTFLAVAVFSFTGNLGAVNIIAMSYAAESGYAPQVSDELGIKVTATLQKILQGAKTWDVEVSLETHTHALSEMLENSAVLIADGKQYQPLGWEGSPPGGHHRKGLLRFAAVTPRPASVELQIRLVGDPTPRSFKWKLK